MESIYEKISKKYNVKLNFVQKGDKFCEANGEDIYINNSYCTFDEIWIGIYEDEEKKLAFFFHEIGHIIDPIDWSLNCNNSKNEMELWAWEIGFKLAKSYGIVFNKEIYDWAKMKSDSYK